MGGKADIDVDCFASIANVILAWPNAEAIQLLGGSVFRVQGGGSVFVDLTARDAALKARALRRTGLNDVEIFQADDSRISQYALDQIVRSEA